MKNHRLTNTELQNLGKKVIMKNGTIPSPVPQLSPITNQAVEAMLRK